MSEINYISLASFIEQHGKSSKYITFPFYKNGQPLEAGNSSAGRNVKKWGMTLLTASSMRFRWNETNEKRTALLKEIVNAIHPPVCSGNCGSNAVACDCKYSSVPLELIHSKIVYDIKTASDTKGLQGDGMITDNRLLVPVVTVADCVPVYFYDDVKGVSGVVHSGWKGTGIIACAIEKAVKEYGCSLENICVAIGPHIGDCCYFVDKERAAYFTDNFGLNCVSELNEAAGEKSVDGLGNYIDGRTVKLNYRLSLTEANLFAIKAAGIPEKNIVVATDCTCCTKFNDGTNVFGSFRRQAAFLPVEIDADTRSRSMTVQAAFVV